MSFFRGHPRLAAIELAAVVAFGLAFGFANVSATATIAAGVVLLVLLCLATAPAIVARQPRARVERPRDRHGVAGA